MAKHTGNVAVVMVRPPPKVKARTSLELVHVSLERKYIQQFIFY